MAERKPIPQDIQDNILTSSARRCCLCFGINSDFNEKNGQIAHIDQDPANPDFENLAFLCLDHHDQYDGKRKQSKNITAGEVKRYRNMLYQAVEKRRKDGGELSPTKTVELSFDAGLRIKQVREELHLKTSQFAELLKVASQREYESMEAGSNEVSLQILERTSAIAGISIDWLKHERTPRYRSEHVYLNPVDEDLAFCKSLNAKEYFLILDKKRLNIALIAQTDTFSYQLITTSVTLDFWNWIDSHWAIPAFYEFLQRLSAPWHDIEGVLLPSKVYKQLEGGEIHFLAALESSDRYGKDLLYDILDIDEQRKRPFLTYTKAYGGNWMNKAHKSYKDIMAQIALNKDFDDEFIKLCKHLKDKNVDVSYLEKEYYQYHGVFAAKRIFYWEKGFEELKMMQKLELLHLSIEVLVLNKKYRTLFTKDDINEAQRRLKELGYLEKSKHV